MIKKEKIETVFLRFCVLHAKYERTFSPPPPSLPLSLPLSPSLSLKFVIFSQSAFVCIALAWTSFAFILSPRRGGRRDLQLAARRPQVNSEKEGARV